MNTTQPNPQAMTKTCQRCRQLFEVEDLTIGGINLGAYLEHCEPCAGHLEEAAIQARHTEEARVRYQSAVPKLYQLTDTNHPDYPREAHDLGQKWAMGQRPANSFWFGIIGAPGEGKTRVLSQVLKRMGYQGQVPEWTTSTRFAWNCENMFSDEHGKKARFHLDRFLRAGVLVFDDLGKQRWTARVCSQFFDLLEYRNSQMLPLLWSSNDSLDSLGNSIPEGPRDAIIDRLRGNSLILEL